MWMTAKIWPRQLNSQVAQRDQNLHYRHTLNKADWWVDDSIAVSDTTGIKHIVL